MSLFTLIVLSTYLSTAPVIAETRWVKWKVESCIWSHININPTSDGGANLHPRPPAYYMM